MRHGLLPIVALVAAACDASSSFTFRASIFGMKGAYVLEADGAEVPAQTPEGSPSSDKFIFERGYPSYAAALAAPPTELRILDHAGTQLGSGLLAPRDCQYFCDGRCDPTSLDLEEKTFDIRADHSLAADGCFRCISGPDLVIGCP